MARGSCKEHGEDPRAGDHVRCLCSTAVPSEFQRGQRENKLCRL